MHSDRHEYTNIIELLKNLDLAYAFKKKRLRFIHKAFANIELRYLRDNFNDILIQEGAYYRIKDQLVSAKAFELITGVFGNSDEAVAIMDINSAMNTLDKKRFGLFLDEHISTANARKNFFRKIYGESNSIISMVQYQIKYLARIIPTLKKFDVQDSSSLVLDRNDLDTVRLIVSQLPEIMHNLTDDIGLYDTFIRDFKKMYRSNALVDIVGYGEISTVMRLKKTDLINEFEGVDYNDSYWIWKKMPPFPNLNEVHAFQKLYVQYRDLLIQKLDIFVPAQVIRYFKHDDYYTVYAGQEKVDDRCIGNILIKTINRQNAEILLMMILKKLNNVSMFNKKNESIKIGIDAQLSNWVFISKHKTLKSVHPDDDLLYIDTSSPFIRINGEDQINTEIFIKSAASFLRPIIRRFFLQQVLDRYYDMRLVSIDLIANLYKEKRIDLIDKFIAITNDYYSKTGMSDNPISKKEIQDYYLNDAFIWKFYQASRKIDRFITEKILRKKYLFRISGKIER